MEKHRTIAVSQIARLVVSYTSIISVGLHNIQVVGVSEQDWTISMLVHFNTDHIATARTVTENKQRGFKMNLI
jgi:hypothetical protein